MIEDGGSGTRASAIAARPPSPAFSRAAGRAVCVLALGGVLVASWMLAVSRSAGFDVSPEALSWMGGPLHGLGSILSGPGHRVAVVVLGGSYLIVIACAARGLLSPAAAIVTVVVASGLFAVSGVPPAQDLFAYLGFGRLAELHGINPYSHGLIAAPGDPVFGLAVAKWRYGSTPYGPVFTLVTMVVAVLPLAVAAWTLKCALWAATLACVGLVGLIARELGRDATLAAAFVGLNPAVLLYVCGKGHNDGLMMLPLLLAVLLVVRKRELWAGMLSVVAVGVKATGGVVLPFLAIGATDRRRVALGIAAAALVVGLITFAIFGTGPFDVLSSARRDAELVKGDFSLLGLIGDGLGQDWHTLARRSGIEIFAVLYVIVLFASLRRPRDWIRWSGWAMVALLATSAELWPWYVLWLLPFAALAGDRALTAGALALTGISLAVQL